MKAQRIEQIARIAHETNRAYCESIGDTSQLRWEEAPNWQRRSAINGVTFHVGCHDMGETPSPDASHNCWLKGKAAEGWKYGPVKNPEKKEHPCFLPYDELPLEQRLKDYLFTAVVSAFLQADAKPAPGMLPLSAKG